MMLKICPMSQIQGSPADPRLESPATRPLPDLSFSGLSARATVAPNGGFYTGPPCKTAASAIATAM